MLLLIYNIIQILLLLLLSPFLVVVILSTPKYRGRMRRRLGFGLGHCVVAHERKVVWVHALSVGELSSARPLLHEIKKRYSECFLVLSTTTKGGEIFSESLKDSVDLIIPFPFDILVTVKKFISTIKPDLFILIETDYWPNFLSELRRQGVPSILANGRITAQSMRDYRRGRLFFKMLFRVFDLVAMQTEQDASNIVGLGVAPSRVMTMGNLKYDSLIEKQGREHQPFGLPGESPVVVAGSTHPGEEEIIIEAFVQLLHRYPDLIMVIAPRDISRGSTIVQMAKDYGVEVSLRSEKPPAVSSGTLLVLDTLGELSSLYREADIVFVGGSLKKFGGHNPLEAAMFGKPVLFGPHMEDFQEIAADLLRGNGAKEVRSQNELLMEVSNLLELENSGEEMGRNGRGLVEKNSGAALRYVEIIGKILWDKEIQ